MIDHGIIINDLPQCTPMHRDGATTGRPISSKSSVVSSQALAGPPRLNAGRHYGPDRFQSGVLAPDGCGSIPHWSTNLRTFRWQTGSKRQSIVCLDPQEKTFFSYGVGSPSSLSAPYCLPRLFDYDIDLWQTVMMAALWFDLLARMAK